MRSGRCSLSQDAPAWADTLAGELASVVRDVRGLHEEFGTRRFRVLLLWLAWSGTQRGAGACSVMAEYELRPTPEVYDDAQLSLRWGGAGAFKDGEWSVEQICYSDDRAPGGALTADFLLGQTPPGTAGPIPPNVEFLWELRAIQPGGRTLRFRVAGDPAASPMGWAVKLRHTTPDSTADGRTAQTVTF